MPADSCYNNRQNRRGHNLATPRRYLVRVGCQPTSRHTFSAATYSCHNLLTCGSPSGSNPLPLHLAVGEGSYTPPPPPPYMSDPDGSPLGGSAVYSVLKSRASQNKQVGKGTALWKLMGSCKDLVLSLDSTFGELKRARQPALPFQQSSPLPAATVLWPQGVARKISSRGMPFWTANGKPTPKSEDSMQETTHQVWIISTKTNQNKKSKIPSRKKKMGFAPENVRQSLGKPPTGRLECAP